MKKIFGFIASALAVLGSAFALAACSDGEHTAHDFSGAWVNTDPEYHWHVCQADGCDAIDEKVAHVWVADTSKTDVPATCIADGIHYLKCECGATKSEVITDRSDHDFKGEWVTTDPEYHWHICTTEGCDEIDEKIAHKWVADTSKTDVPATCHSDGIHYLKCECGAEKTEAITNRPDHDFTGKPVYTDETGHWHVCVNAGCEATDEKVAHNCNSYEKKDDNVHSKTCECGYSVDESHAWDDGTVTKEPSETETGIRTYTCSVCHGTKTEVIPEKSHVHTPNAGWEKDDDSHWHTCSGCSEKVDKADHIWLSNPDKTDVPATCHSDGISYFKCSVCDREKSEVITDRPAHDFTGEWIDTDAEGHYHKCKNCEATDDKVPHEWVADTSKTDVAATCHSDGIHYLKCSECGAEKSEPITERPDHDFTGEFEYTDETGHWHVCKNDGCEATDEKLAHVCDSYAKVDENEHSKICECGYSVNEAHNWNDGVITTKPTLTTAGVKTFTCSHCSATYTERIAPKAVFKDDFTLSPADNHPWTYGYIADGDFADDKFTVTEFTATEGDAYVMRNEENFLQSELKADWVNEWRMVVIGYTVTQDINVKVTANITGDMDNSEYSLRYGVKAADGVSPIDAHWFGRAKELRFNRVFSLKSGDTVYLLINGEIDGAKNAHFDITLTEAIADFTNDFMLTPAADHPWSYGYVADKDFKDDIFTVTPMTKTDADSYIAPHPENDEWTGAQIKSDWINEWMMMAIGYTAAEDMTIKLDLTFTGDADNTKFSLRYGVKASGSEEPTHAEWVEQGKDINFTHTIELKAGDTVYLLLKGEDGDKHGHIGITITQE